MTSEEVTEIQPEIVAPEPKEIIVGKTVVDIHGQVASSDDDEGNPLNRIGDVPLEWYDGEEHIGYDAEGKKLLKKEQSAIDSLLFSVERGNLDRYKTIIDRLHGNEMIKLSSEDLEILHRIQNNQYASKDYDPYQDLPPDTAKISSEGNPFTRGTVSKKIYVPRQKPATQDDTPKEQKPTSPEFNFDLWKDSWKKPSPRYIAAPQLLLPLTAESYNPPLEYIPTEEEYRKAKKETKDSLESTLLPVKFECLRHVPWYKETLAERYQRCLDLFAFPRIKRQKLQIADPDDLLPRLPPPRDLRPYPEILAMEYPGHQSAVRTISVSPDGQWLATGCDDHILRVFEIRTGRLIKQYDLRGTVNWVQFGPVQSCPYLVAAVENEIVFFAASVASLYHSSDHKDAPKTKFDKMFSFDEVRNEPLRVFPEGETDTQSASITTFKQTIPEDDLAKFTFPKESTNGLLLSVRIHAAVHTGSIHRSGDYVAVVAPDDAVRQRRVVLLNIETKTAICPFKLRSLCKDGTKVIGCTFFDHTPNFLVLTSAAAYIFDLKEQSLLKKLRPGGTSLTAAGVHPLTGHVICSAHSDAQRSIMLFEGDGEEKPVQKFPAPFTGSTILSASFHRRAAQYPLLALGDTSGHTSIFNVRSLMDDEILDTKASIIPLRNLRCESQSATTAAAFHPSLPWAFTASAKGEVLAWVEL